MTKQTAEQTIPPAPDQPSAASAGTSAAASVALFGELASDWWDPDGRSKLLHRINPVRLRYIREVLERHFGLNPRDRQALAGLAALDIGCGGGLVTEPLARMGASVEGLDAGEKVIEVARAHAMAQGLSIRYTAGDVVPFAAEREAHYDFITCLEVIEHVADIPAFLQSIRRMLKPGGLLIFSTPNRSARSWLALIVGAEWLLKLIPDGGHDWNQLLTPAELDHFLTAAGLQTDNWRGLDWSPGRGFFLSDNKAVNYLGTAIPVAVPCPA